MATETIIIDAGKFGYDTLLAQAVTLGSWFTGNDAAYELHVDYDGNLHFTIDPDVAVHFKLMFHDIMVSEEKLKQRGAILAQQHMAAMAAQQQYMAALNVQHSLATPFYNNIQQAVAKLGGTP